MSAGQLLRASIAILAVAAQALILVNQARCADIAAASMNDYWTVIDISGHARELPGVNPWQEARDLKPGDLIGPYQSVATDLTSEVTLVRGGDAIMVYSGSIVRLPPTVRAGAETRIAHDDGEALYAVAPASGLSFEVTTPYLVAGVKGTHFAVTEGGQRVILIQGVLSITAARSGATAELLAGHEIVVRSARAEDLRARDAPPDVLLLWQGRAAALVAKISAARSQRADLDAPPDGDSGGASQAAATSDGSTIDMPEKDSGRHSHGAKGAVSHAADKVGRIVGGLTGGLLGR